MIKKVIAVAAAGTGLFFAGRWVVRNTKIGAKAHEKVRTSAAMVSDKIISIASK